MRQPLCKEYYSEILIDLVDTTTSGSFKEMATLKTC